MRILAEIRRADGINIHGKTIHRTAVRGIILRGQNLLMIYSSTVGDYKFPGGGLIEERLTRRPCAEKSRRSAAPH